MHVNYKNFWLCIYLFTFGCGEPQNPEQEGDRKNLPNVILIVSDDQGYNDLGCYGAKDIQTPHLDQLAAEGARLTSFYVSSSVCTPSRSGLLTGRYPQRNGTYELFRNELPDVGHEYSEIEYSTSAERILGTDVREVFISEMLKEAGYTNGIFGKWDLGQLRRFLPLQQGFDDFYGFVNTGIDYFTHERYGVPSMYQNNEPTTADSGMYATDLFEREALRFLKENKDNSFFLYLPFNAPHNASNLQPEIRRSVQAPEEYLQKYPEAASAQAQRRRGYMAAATCMDDAIGHVLRSVKEYGLEENTLVIFLSDNGGSGGSDNSPLRGGKARFLEGGIRVPCIIKWPGRIEKGKVIDDFLTSLEIFPTLLAATGMQQPDSLVLDGFDMLAVLEGKEASPREEMYWELRGDEAARVSQWKWVNTKRDQGLFDLSQDVGEKNDLSETQPEILQMVKDKFHQWQQEMQEAEPRGPFRDF